LWRYRYIYAESEKYSLVKELYREAFGLEESFLVNLHDFLISPFVYNGEWSDKNKGAQAYENLFDIPLERAERKPIIEALSANHLPRSAEAGILQINQKQVEVTHRALEAKELEPGVVQLNFHERYLNRSYSQQEVFYYFSLPANCVLTGMWLSDSDSNHFKYPYAIAPRGAAQKTYRQIRARRMDPALLEQVGPFQYRLRIFPIPARTYYSPRDKRDQKEPEPMHITLRLLSISENGEIPVPKLIEKRNVFWQEGLANCKTNQWFPTLKKTFSPYAQQPLDAGVEKKMRASLAEAKPKGKRIVLIDGSYSMQKFGDEFNTFWGKYPFKNTTDMYLLESKQIGKVTADSVDFTKLIGTNDAFLALKKLSEKHPKTPIIWLSDKGNYELLASNPKRTKFKHQASIDVVHLNGYAPIYDDVFLESILASGGSVFANGEEWLAWSQKKMPDGLFWREEDAVIIFSDSVKFDQMGATAPMWASRYTMAQNQRMQIGEDLGALDELHKLATKHSFVSPFSSFICLVNDRQKELLKESSEDEDRFNREIETGKSTPSNETLNAFAVPEPHEWLMLFLAGILLIVLYRKRLKMS
jgi:putative PEP-CTERM system integral membrane protein